MLEDRQHLAAGWIPSLTEGIVRVVEFRVTGLFDRFNHELIFPKDERISIMFAPNGFGKTTILRMINALFNQPLRTLALMPFRELRVQLDDGTFLTAIRKERPPAEEGERAEFDIDLIYQSHDGKKESYRPSQKLSQRDIGIPLDSIEDIVPRLGQIGGALWRDLGTGETLELEEVIDRFGDQLPIRSASNPKTPKWLQNIRKGIPVHFIDTERLTRPLMELRRIRRPHWIPTPGMERTVRHYSEELGKRIQEVLSEYGVLSQSLDRTFPARLVKEPPQSDFTLDSLRNELVEVEEKRRKLVQAGLLTQDEEAWGATAPNIDNLDQSQRGVLAVYARDAKQKLSVFDEILAKVDALKRIANARFLHKSVSIGTNGIFVETPAGKRLNLEMLSSGEQHELVLLYDLLFRVSKNSFILIDEPELSLHIAWQEKFLSDIEEMARLSDFRVLLATHSPQIIGDHFDLTVELKSPN